MTNDAERVEALEDGYKRLSEENEKLREALMKVSAIRDSIVGTQGFNFSEHAYPLVAVLDEAGFPGAGYEIARKNLGTLIERAVKAEDEVERLRALLPPPARRPAVSVTEARKWLEEHDEDPGIGTANVLPEYLISDDKGVPALAAFISSAGLPSVPAILSEEEEGNGEPVVCALTPPVGPEGWSVKVVELTDGTCVLVFSVGVQHFEILRAEPDVDEDARKRCEWFAEQFQHALRVRDDLVRAKALPGDPYGHIDLLVSAIFGVSPAQAHFNSINDAAREAERLRKIARTARFPGIRTAVEKSLGDLIELVEEDEEAQKIGTDLWTAVTTAKEVLRALPDKVGLQCACIWVGDVDAWRTVRPCEMHRKWAEAKAGVSHG